MLSASGCIGTPRESITVSDNPGFHTISLHPNFDARLGHLSLDYDSAYGTIHSEWAVAGTHATWKITVPPNSTAVLATRNSNASGFQLDGAPVEGSARLGKGSAEGDFTLPSGSYTFTATLKATSEVALGTH